MLLETYYKTRALKRNTKKGANCDNFRGGLPNEGHSSVKVAEYIGKRCGASELQLFMLLSVCGTFVFRTTAEKVILD